MTEIKNNAPAQDREQNTITIRLIEQQARKIDFHKPCLEQIIIKRRINHEPWRAIAKNARLPYVDEEAFESSVLLEYHIQLIHQNSTSDDYFLKDSIPK